MAAVVLARVLPQRVSTSPSPARGCARTGTGSVRRDVAGRAAVAAAPGLVPARRRDRGALGPAAREPSRCGRTSPCAPPAVPGAPRVREDGRRADGDRGTATAVGPPAPVPVDADDPDSPFPVAAPDGPLRGRPRSCGRGRPASAPTGRRDDPRTSGPRPRRTGAAGPTRPPDEASPVTTSSSAAVAPARPRSPPGTVTSSPPTARSSRRDLAPVRPDRVRRRTSATTEPTSEVFPGLPRRDDAGLRGRRRVPHARPVEAPRGGDETMDPMDTPDMTDDEREAAEIRRMREQARRGDTA